ncbi:MAG: hypothetical protein KAQ92_04155 [Candidatus Aenigmarchaeota archaeon]|nr:hypothetical protein [Candidatus Aenigmarchaeota archaeon]
MEFSNISFTADAKEDILDLYDKTIDDNGFIVEKENTNQKVLTKNGEDIHIDEWGGIIKGSEEFIKSDIFSLIQLARKLK